jgi:hypothetical protein
MSRRRTCAVAGVYTAVAIAVTWPLARHLGRDVAWDLGDSLLNMWILSWDCEQLRAILGGHIDRIAHFFDANIFYPELRTLAYSEHLFAQAVQVFPIYLATRNPILCYNLLFLSTYVLSGLGMYLLGRELTRDWRTAFVAGLLFAFASYRIPQASHVQLLSSQWMPFTLYALTRYFETRRIAAIAAATTALVAQNLSCGYYLLFFTPVAAGYTLWEIGRRRLWRDWRTWTHLIAAAVVVTAITVLFLLPYQHLRAHLQLGRGPEEVVSFSADVYSYFSAFATQNVWGKIARPFPKAEGQLFPGLIPIILAAAGIGTWLMRAWRDGRRLDTERGVHRSVVVTLGAAWLVVGTFAVVGIFMRRLVIDAGLVTLRVTSITRLLIWIAMLTGALLVLSPRARARARALAAPPAFFVVTLVVAWWLSLGPDPRVLGRHLELPAPYLLLYDHVPGFSGLRVPARLAMIVTLMLSVLAAYGVLPLIRRRFGTIAAAVLSIAFIFESHSRPFLINAVLPGRDFNTPQARVFPPSRAPEAYRALRTLSAYVVLLELPIGTPAYDLRAVYYSTAHWRPLINGYSGFFPPHYPALVAALTEPFRHNELSRRALEVCGATHVLVHEDAYRDDEGRRISAWLRTSGAVEVTRDAGDVLLALPR